MCNGPSQAKMASSKQFSDDYVVVVLFTSIRIVECVGYIPSQIRFWYCIES